MRFLLAIVLVGISLKVNAQSQISFPKSFVGNWSGTLELSPVAKPSQTVNMELRIQPSKDTAGHYTWNLIYGAPGTDNRPYILKPVDTARGHWVIDELNGIVLDEYFIKDRLVGVFTVQQSTIVSSYTLNPDGQMEVEFITFLAKPLVTTGKGDESSPSVDSYEIRSIQKAILKRSK